MIIWSQLFMVALGFFGCWILIEELIEWSRESTTKEEDNE